MKKRLWSMVVVAVMALSMFSGCANDEATSSKDGERITLTVAYPGADQDALANDEYYKYITDKVGVDLEFQALSADSASEKARILIASGDMADITYCDFSFNEYINYGQQGMVKTLPADWEEKYPNLGFSMAMTGMLSKIKDTTGGDVYGLIRPMDHYHDFLEEFRTAYAEGKDLKELMNDPKYLFIDKYGFAYRKDWAQKLGIETDYIMDYDDFIDMVLKFKEADLGGVGAENTVGIAVDYTEAPNIFITAHNSSYKFFHKDDSGKYVCGLLEDSTTEGVKAYADAYRNGVLAPGFYTQRGQDLNSLFCSQRSGVIFPRGNVSDLRKLFPEFENANPGLKAEDCIDVCWIRSKDGKVHGREDGNYYGGYYFNPDISDEKLAKALELADYISSPEGGPQVKLGVPNKDYKVENGQYINIRERDEEGNMPTLDKLYPSYGFFAYYINPQYQVLDETNPYALSCAQNLLAAKRKNELSLLNWDVDRESYVEDAYVKFNAAYDVNSMFAEIIVSEGDVEQKWLAKRAEISKAAQPIIKDINNALVNK